MHVESRQRRTTDGQTHKVSRRFGGSHDHKHPWHVKEHTLQAIHAHHSNAYTHRHGVHSTRTRAVTCWLRAVRPPGALQATFRGASATSSAVVGDGARAQHLACRPPPSGLQNWTHLTDTDAAGSHTQRAAAHVQHVAQTADSHGRQANRAKTRDTACRITHTQTGKWSARAHTHTHTEMAQASADTQNGGRGDRGAWRWQQSNAAHVPALVMHRLLTAHGAAACGFCVCLLAPHTSHCARD
jgi:hypothetical protein